jgi:hypothetical protein
VWVGGCGQASMVTVGGDGQLAAAGARSKEFMFWWRGPNSELLEKGKDRFLNLPIFIS